MADRLFSSAPEPESSPSPDRRQLSVVWRSEPDWCVLHPEETPDGDGHCPLCVSRLSSDLYDEEDDTDG